MTNGVPGTPNVVTFNMLSTCQDNVGRPVVDSSFLSNQTVRTARVDGVASAPGFLPNQVVSIVFEQCPLTISTTSVNTGLLAAPGGWYLTTVARTNPSRPELTPASIIQDLYELPSMLRDVGKLLETPTRLLSAKDAGNKNLAVQFGWLPFIRDINLLLDLQAHILRRRRELSKLFSGKGLRRRITLAEDTQFGRATQTYSFGKGSITILTDITVVREVWATIRWKPSSAVLEVPGDHELNLLARRLVLGLTPEGLVKGAWDLLPWTWLVGWFSNVGDYLTAVSDTVPATHSGACLMNKMVCTVVPSPAIASSGVVSTAMTSGVYINSIRSRTPSGVPTPGFSIPFIGMNRLSILGSLAVQRFVR
jgi:hypothetical protein